MEFFASQKLSIKLYLTGLWFWLKSFLIVPGTYLCAVYCCTFELFLDLFCDKPFKQRFDEWTQSSLLNEHPQTKRIAVLTGADGTIGTEVSRLLLELGFEIAIFGLHRPRLSFLKDWERLHLFKCDLMVPNQVHAAINEFQAQFDHIDLMIFNAGVMLHPPLKDPNAVDPHFSVNLLSHALIFDDLRPYIEKSPRTSPKALILSSSTSNLGNLQRFIYGDSRRAFRDYHNGYKSYADSKLYVNLYFRQLGNLLRGTKIKCASVHPGVVSGSLYRHVFRPFRFVINNFLKFIIRSNERAAIEILSMAFNDNLLSGRYYEHLRANDLTKDYSALHLRHLYEAVQLEIR